MKNKKKRTGFVVRRIRAVQSRVVRRIRDWGRWNEQKRVIRVIADHGTFLPARVSLGAGLIGPGLLVWEPSSSSCGRE